MLTILDRVCKAVYLKGTAFFDKDLFAGFIFSEKESRRSISEDTKTEGAKLPAS